MKKMNKTEKQTLKYLCIDCVKEMFAPGYQHPYLVDDKKDCDRCGKQMKKEKQIRQECIEEILKVFDSKQLIGNVSKKFEDMRQKDYDWKSFYTGWMEGQVRILELLRDSLEKNE